MERSATFGEEDPLVARDLQILREGARDDKIGARNRLAHVFEQRGMLEEAVACYETNVGVGVRDRGVYERLASLYRQQGHTELAEEVLADARSLPSRAGPSATAPLATGRAAARGRAAGAGRRQSSGWPWYATPAAIVVGLLVCGSLLYLSPMRTMIDSFSGRSAGGVSPTAEPQPAASPSPSPRPGAVVGASPSPSPSSVVITPGGANPSPSVALSPSPAPASPSPSAVRQASPALARVRVSNSGAEGASLRANAGSTAARLKILPEGTVLDVVGPDRSAEGRLWRNVRDSVGASGWIVSELLSPAP